MDNLTPTMPLVPANTNVNDGMMNGGSWIWILLIFVLLGGNGFGGLGNGGVGATPATNLINNDFLYTQQKIDNLNQGLVSQTNQINQSLCQGFGGVQSSIANLGFQLQQCCCNIERTIDQSRFEATQNKCDITTAIGASTQAIKDLINGNTMQDLRDDRERWREMYSQSNQTNAITGYVTQAINQRFPYPAPANVVGYGYPGFGAGYPGFGFAPFGIDGFKDGRCGHDGHHGHCGCNPCC